MRYAGSIDIGGSKTIVGIVSDEGKVLVTRRFEGYCPDFSQHIDKCVVLLRECLAELNKEVSELVGCGLVLPGMGDREKGLFIRAPYAGWSDLPAADMLRKALGVELVICDNDSNLCAEGEMYFGETKNDFLWMTVSNGVGGAVILDKKVRPGSTNAAGEIGHVKVEFENPRRCSCGQYGCAEAECSGTGIGYYFKKKIAEDANFAKIVLDNGVAESAQGCAELARLGYAEAQALFDYAGSRLGLAISHAANIINPEQVFIGGGVSNSFDLLKSSIYETFYANTLKECSNVEIKPTALGYYAALIGAAATIFKCADEK